MTFDGGSDGKVRRQRATKTTVRIELKWQMADGCIGGDRYCRHPQSSSVVDNVFDGGGAPSLSDCSCCCYSFVISFPPSLSRGGALPDQDGKEDDEEDNNIKDDDRSRTDQSPPVAVAAWSILGLLQGSRMAGCDNDGRRRRRQRARLGW
jgi:hypothetical protein